MISDCGGFGIDCVGDQLPTKEESAFVRNWQRKRLLFDGLLSTDLFYSVLYLVRMV